MKLAVFDLDGTLTRTNEVDDQCFVQAFADALGIHELNTNWSEYEHVTDLGCLQQAVRTKLNRPISISETAIFIDCFVGLLRKRQIQDSTLFQEIAGAALMLARLKQSSDWTVAIATGCWQQSAQFKIEVAGIPAKGLPAAFADDGPSRESIVRTAIARAGTAFERIISIGDADWDVRTARRLELPFIGIGGPRRAERLRQAGARHTTENFLDQDGFMRALEEAVIPS
jgi:phosphoglycolate phosphatase-like HAD superfamily hydrolase